MPKKRKNVSKPNLLIKNGHGSSVGKLEEIAKEFDITKTKKKKKVKPHKKD